MERGSDGVEGYGVHTSLRLTHTAAKESNSLAPSLKSLQDCIPDQSDRLLLAGAEYGSPLVEDLR